MFDRFVDHYSISSQRRPWSPPSPELDEVEGYHAMSSLIGDSAVCDGMYRLLTAQWHREAIGFIATGFPEFAQRALPFGVDWLGRITAVDRHRTGKLLLVEPGSGDAFEIEESFVDFFDVDLVDDPETFLASDLHTQWRELGGSDPGAGYCVGFKVPLFLGGDGSTTNLELTDLSVYWTLSAQLRAATRGLPPGTKVGALDQP